MKKLLLISLITAMFSSAASAQDVASAYSAHIKVPVNSPLDNRVKFYAYTPDVVYELPITVGMHTHLEMGKDESLIETPTIGETIQWRITGNEKNLYIKALQPNVRTSLTLITTKRTYQFELVSTTDSAKRVQKAYFQYPEAEEAIALNLKKYEIAKNQEDARIESLNVGQAVSPESLNFSYKVVGDSSFKPNAVYDDGKFTFFRLNGSQDLPAIFILADGSKNKLIPVNYTVKKDQVIVDRIANIFILKLGNQEIKIIKG